MHDDSLPLLPERSRPRIQLRREDNERTHMYIKGIKRKVGDGAIVAVDGAIVVLGAIVALGASIVAVDGAILALGACV